VTPTPLVSAAGRPARAPHFSKQALAFLRSLARNNRRDWFTPRKEQYDTLVRAPMIEFVQRFAEDLAVFAPDHIAEPKLSIFRIYRDTRFSHDKTPYKTNIAAYFPHRHLPKNEGAGLYIEVAPKHVWYGGGVYMPSSRELLLIRQHLAAHHRRFETLLRAAAFKKAFGTLQGETLTRVPRGFLADHPAAGWLRHRQFLAAAERPAEFATSDDFYKTVSTAFKAGAPLMAFLNEPLVAAVKAAEARRPWGDTRR
jgi:uncharacterized protein (TIGR02453 family)